MRVAFDTSLLVPGLVRSHPWHRRALVWLEAAAAGKIQGVASWHAMAETWSVLTRLPLRPSLSPQRARLVVETLERHLELVVPDGEIYQLAIQRCADKGVASGAVFDAIHVVSAERSTSDLLLTFNTKDFERLLKDSRPLVLEPPDPPSLTPTDSRVDS